MLATEALNIASDPIVKISRNKITYRQFEFFKIKDAQEFSPSNVYSSIQSKDVQIKSLSDNLKWTTFLIELQTIRLGCLNEICEDREPNVVHISFKDIPMIIDIDNFGPFRMANLKNHPYISHFEMMFQWKAKRSFRDKNFKVSGFLEIRVDFRDNSEKALECRIVELVSGAKRGSKINRIVHNSMILTSEIENQRK